MVAIAADELAQTAKLERAVPGVKLLDDPELAVTAAWGLRVGDAESPLPATFVIRDGVVRWRWIDGAHDWPSYAALASHLGD